MQRSQRHLGQALQNEPHLARIDTQSGAHTLPPVPAPTGDPLVIPPDHLAGLHRFVGRLASLHGIEQLAAIGHHQSRQPLIGEQVFAPHRNGVADADGVVEIDHGIDGRQVAIAGDPLSQSLGGTGSPLRLGAELSEQIAPGGEMRLCPRHIGGQHGAAGLIKGSRPHVRVDHGGGLHRDAQSAKAGSQLADFGGDMGGDQGHSDSINEKGREKAAAGQHSGDGKSGLRAILREHVR